MAVSLHLEASGWECSIDHGAVADDRPQWVAAAPGASTSTSTIARPRVSIAFFKHSRALAPGDVFKLRVEGGDGALVGLATEQYVPESHALGTPGSNNTCFYLGLDDGSSTMGMHMSMDGKSHDLEGTVLNHVPVAYPYDVALRCNKITNSPQVQFNDDDVWHNLGPEMKAGPWFPCVALDDGDHVSDIHATRPRPTKSAEKVCKRVKLSE